MEPHRGQSLVSANGRGCPRVSTPYPPLVLRLQTSRVTSPPRFARSAYTGLLACEHADGRGDVAPGRKSRCIKRPRARVGLQPHPLTDRRGVSTRGWASASRTDLSGEPCRSIPPAGMLPGTSPGVARCQRSQEGTPVAPPWLAGGPRPGHVPSVVPGVGDVATGRSGVGILTSADAGSRNRGSPRS
jgi:hypothetical protein